MLTLFRSLFIALISCGAAAVLSQSCQATLVTFGMGADDYGSLTVNVSNVCTYDNISAAGGCNGSVNMTPGVWYDISIDYKNRLGSDGMALTWDQSGTAQSFGYGSVADALAPSLVPLVDLRTLNASSYVSGLTGNYYDLDGTFVKTVVGEGPIHAINNVYDNAISPDDWAGFGYFSLFEERLTGQIMLAPAAGVPEPSSMIVFLSGLGILMLVYRGNRRMGDRAIRLGPCDLEVRSLIEGDVP